MPVRQDGVKQKPFKLLAIRTRLCLFIVSLILWLEGRTPQWRSTLGYRLRNVAYQCEVMGQRVKTLVFRMCGFRSSPSLILAALEHQMATLDRRDDNEEENMTLPLPACDWCRMGLHKKCDHKEDSKVFCICDCDRGF